MYHTPSWFTQVMSGSGPQSKPYPNISCFLFLSILLSFPTPQTQIRYRKDKVQSKQTPTFSVVSGVKDLSNGCAIAATIHFYCPQILALEGKRSVTISNIAKKELLWQVLETWEINQCWETSQASLVPEHSFWNAAWTSPALLTLINQPVVQLLYLNVLSFLIFFRGLFEGHHVSSRQLV